MAAKEDFAVTDKVLEKIGDHFNNPEMSDRILVVKVRPLGWEIQEAAKLAQNAIKTAYVKKERSEQTPKQDIATDASCSLPRVDKKSSSSLEDVFQNDYVDRDLDPEETKSISGDTNTDSLDCSKQREPNSKCGTKRRKNHSLDSSFVGEELNCQSVQDECESTLQTIVQSDNINENVQHLLDEKMKNLDSVVPEEVIYVVDCEKEEEIIQADKRVCIEEVHQTDLLQNDIDSCVVCQHEIYVHSFWLALNSPFFRGLFFSSGFKETKDNKVCVK